MLKSIGVNCVIIGHSERRSLFGETDQILFEKLNYATSNDMNVIFVLVKSFNKDKMEIILM